MTSKAFQGLIGLAMAATLSVTQSAAATERHFGFSEESGVLKPGLAELQPWTTARSGRVDYYSRIDARLAFQLGLAKNLQGALFWNASSITEDIQIPGAALKSRLSVTDFQSLTAQLKYKLTDPVADALGSALLVNGVFGPMSLGVEGRLILDRQLGSLLLALNLMGGRVSQLELVTRSVNTFGASVATGYFVTPNLVTSLEVRNENSHASLFDSSVLYLGPSVSFVSTRYWLTLTVQPQVAAFKGASDGHHLDLSQNEYLQTRLLLGFPL